MRSEVATPFYVTAAGLVSVILIGWLLMIGQSLIIPVIIAVISVYLLSAASSGLGRIAPVLTQSPRIRGLVVPIIFIGVIAMFAAFLADNAVAISNALPAYAENLNQLIADFSEGWGITDVPTVASLMDVLRDRLDLAALAQSALGTVSSIGSVIIMAICYTLFLSADLKDMPRKLELAAGSEDSAKGSIALVLNPTVRPNRPGLGDINRP